MKDKDIIDLLGLTDRTIKVGVSIEDDLQYMIENGIDKYYEELDKYNQRKKEFVEMFRECYDDIVKIIELDPRKRIAVDCFTCIKGMDLSKQYGRPLKSYKAK